MKDDGKDEDIEFMNLEDNQDSQGSEEDEDWADEPEPLSPWKMALIFAGLVVVAAIICALLWHFTHKGSSDNSEPVPTDAYVETPTDPPTETPGESQLQESAEEPDEDSAQQPEVTKTPDAQDVEESDGRYSAPEPDDVTVPQEPEDGDVSMSFNSVQESVTPKDVVNLRSVPSTADENTVVVQVSNGEVLSRTGINPDKGWSRIDYNGQTLYAVTQYLTTDLNYKPPVQPADPNRVTTVSGRVIIFANCDDQLTPKEYVNLRTEPSTTEGDATVRCQVSGGETVHRTGYSADSGWSRVEYNGEVLYVVTSLMKPVQ